MEAGEYQRLPGAVFVRGFIRNYARLVKLDPAPLVATVEQGLPAHPRAASAMPSSPDIPFPSGRTAHWHKYAIAGLMVAAVLIMFEFYWSSTETPSEVTVTPRPIALPQSQGDAPDRTADGAAAHTAALTAAAIKPGMGAAKSAAPGSPAGAEVPVAAASAVNPERKRGEQRVRLVFEKESWVEIRDRSGRKIFSQLNSAGSAQSVSGQPPLTLVVGNAAGVRIIYNDKPVDLAPHINVDVARLTLE